MNRVDDILKEVFSKRLIQHPDGRDIALRANISYENSEALRRIVLELKPKLAVEIGMAYGVSTLTILGGLEKLGHGRLISIDPYLGWPTGRDVALHQIERAGVKRRHTHMELASYEALPRLLADGCEPELVYIDGNHNFDYVFTDFFFADKLIPVGGVIGFNDAGWRSVHKVIRFLAKYRRYKELEVGLPKAYRSRNYLFSIIKKLEGRSSNDRYFRKLLNWEPDHGFYRMF